MSATVTGPLAAEEPGATRAQIDTMLVANPRRFFSAEPR